MDEELLIERDMKKLANDLSFESLRQSREFFFHWSLLAGGTLTVVITFIGNAIGDDQIVKNIKFFNSAIGLLVTSTVLAAIRNYLLASMLGNFAMFLRRYTREIDPDAYADLFMKRGHVDVCLRYLLEFIAIGAYVAALIFLTEFIKSNFNS